ncbi:MAG: hypothetical protein WB566_15375 [Terriglobales bacterium]
MYVPGARDRVQIAGRIGVYLVVWVDRERQVADLIPLHESTLAEDNVPFSALEPYSADPPIDIGHQAPE